MRSCSVVSENVLDLEAMATGLEDDDAPPALVDVAAMPSGQPAPMEEQQTPRVPITLVTGMPPYDRICMDILTRDL